MTGVRGLTKVVALFLGYGTLGLSGDYVVGLLADDQVPHVEHAPRVQHDGAAQERVRMRRSGGCAFTLDAEATLAVASGQTLRIEAGAGELSVEGSDDAAAVNVVSRACASEESFLDDLTVTLEQVGGDIVLTAHYPETGRWTGNRTARLDLAIQMPVGMAVDIDDSSGSIDVQGSGDLHIDDSSGSIQVSGARGSVDIEDGSGGIQVADVAGDVRVYDGSGGLEITGVDGNVVLEDGSGSMSVSQVGQSVIVENDGSGSIRVQDVGGDLTVKHDGSGSIRHSGVQGAVDVPVDRKARRERHRG